MTKAEQETVIRWDWKEQLVHIWSADAVIWRKLARLGVAVREETTHKGEIAGRFYQPVPVAMFKFGVKRERTEAQRAAARKAGEKLAAAKKLLSADGPTGAQRARAGKDDHGDDVQGDRTPSRPAVVAAGVLSMQLPARKAALADRGGLGCRLRAVRLAAAGGDGVPARRDSQCDRCEPLTMPGFSPHCSAHRCPQLQMRWKCSRRLRLELDPYPRPD